MDKIITTDRNIQVPVGDGAAMTLPRPEWLWQLNWAALGSKLTKAEK